MAAHRPTTERPPAERRLSATARRAQLVEVAYDVLQADPRLPLSPEVVAARAGVSKPLVFHYFPTVADLQLAVFERVAADLLARLDTGTDIPLDERLRTGVEAFIDYATEHADLYLQLMRGGAAETKLLASMDRQRDRVARLIGQALGLDDPPAAVLVVLRGYVGLVEEAVLEWLGERPVPREALVDFLCGVGDRMVTDAGQLLRASPQ